jgi:hypothetical protein
VDEDAEIDYRPAAEHRFRLYFVALMGFIAGLIAGALFK